MDNYDEVNPYETTRQKNDSDIGQTRPTGTLYRISLKKATENGHTAEAQKGYPAEK